MSHKIRLMYKGEIDEVADSLAKAFINDPLQTYTFSNERERREKSPSHFKAILEFGINIWKRFTLQIMQRVQ